MRAPLLVSSLLALAVRVAVIVALPAPPAWDGAFYARFATRIARGEGYVDPPSTRGVAHPTAFYPIGYPAAVAALLPAAGTAQRAAWAVNLLAALLAGAAVVSVAFRLGGPRVAWTAGLVHALYPGGALWCTAAMTETLTGALLVAAMAAAVASPSSLRHRLTGAGLAGLALGAAVLVRPQSLVLAPLVGLALGPAHPRARLAMAATVTGVALVVVLPWTARNCGALDRCALVSTNGGSNLLIGTFPDALGGYRRPTPRDGCHHVRGEVARDRCMSSLALRQIARHPARWLALAAPKLVRTFAWEFSPVTYPHASLRGAFAGAARRLALALCTLGWWALVGLALAGGRRAWRTGSTPRRVAGLVAASCAAVAATHAVFLGSDRYHLALVPMLAPLAALALSPHLGGATHAHEPVACAR